MEAIFYIRNTGNKSGFTANEIIERLLCGKINEILECLEDNSDVVFDVRHNNVLEKVTLSSIAAHVYSPVNKFSVAGKLNLNNAEFRQHRPYEIKFGSLKNQSRYDAYFGIYGNCSIEHAGGDYKFQMYKDCIVMGDAVPYIGPPELAVFNCFTAMKNNILLDIPLDGISYELRNGWDVQAAYVDYPGWASIFSIRLIENISRAFLHWEFAHRYRHVPFKANLKEFKNGLNNYLSRFNLTIVRTTIVQQPVYKN